jgi:hypothetical protein
VTNLSCVNAFYKIYSPKTISQSRENLPPKNKHCPCMQLVLLNIKPSSHLTCIGSVKYNVEEAVVSFNGTLQF